MRGIFLTGPPGSGKTTLVRELASTLESLGCRVEGIVAPEIREGGKRIGFDICALKSLKCWRLARIGCYSKRYVGKYGVCEREAMQAAEHLRNIVSMIDVVVIDEIGPMELKVSTLRSAIVEVLYSSKPIVAVIHRRLRYSHPEVYRIILSIGPILVLTPKRRDAIKREAHTMARVLARAACRGEGGAGTT